MYIADMLMKKGIALVGSSLTAFEKCTDKKASNTFSSPMITI